MREENNVKPRYSKPIGLHPPQAVCTYSNGSTIQKMETINPFENFYGKRFGYTPCNRTRNGFIFITPAKCLYLFKLIPSASTKYFAQAV